MPRLSLDISREQHRQLKTLASYSGMSMKDFILTRIFVNAAGTIFTTRSKKSLGKNELKTVQSLLFKKAEIITVAPEKWESLKNQAENA